MNAKAKLWSAWIPYSIKLITPIKLSLNLVPVYPLPTGKKGP